MKEKEALKQKIHEVEAAAQGCKIVNYDLYAKRKAELFASGMTACVLYALCGFLLAVGILLHFLFKVAQAVQ